MPLGSVRRPTFVMLAFLAAIVAGGGVAFVRMGRAVRALDAAEEQRRALSDLADALDDAEDAERSYLLVDDPRWQDAYDRAASTWSRRMAKARRVGERAGWRSGIEAIDRRARAALDEMSQTMTSHATPAERAARLRSEDADLSDVRARMDALRVDEKRIESARVAAENGRESSLFVVFFFGVLALGSVASLAAFARDAERKRREHAEERASLLDLADQFIGVLGHDLRNPLGAVTMAGKLMVEQASDEKQRSLARRVVSSGARAQRMIDTMLDLARSRLGGGIPVARTPGDLRDVVANVVDELRTSFGERRIAWTWRGDGAGRWDPDRMAQAVSNLVGNALEHGDPDGAVRVALQGDGHAVELSIHNAGAPIPPETIPTIFESYRRRNAPARTKGLGLGLFIASQIVRAHDGTIRVQSSADEGTTFTVIFPRETVSRTAAPEAPIGGHVC